MRNFYGGTQTWTTTMVRAFRRLGHLAHFTSSDGYINNHFKLLYQPLLPRYDLVIINGSSNIKTFKNKADFSIFISHGILPQLEQPMEGTDLILGVSEEVAKNIEKKGFKCEAILRNPINVEHFSATKINDSLKTIGIVDRRRRIPYLRELSELYEVVEIGNPPVKDVKNSIIKCDLVIGKGRVLYEAMSMGKCVVVSGNNSGRGGNKEIMDGFVDEQSFYEFRKNNCSGRHTGKLVDNFNTLRKELLKYNSKQGILNRELILTNNNYMTIGKNLIEIYENSSS